MSSISLHRKVGKYPQLRYASRQIARKLVRTALCLGGLEFSLVAPAQTFVAEWAEADVGRLGPTGLAVATVGGTDFLYAADQINGRVFTFDLTTDEKIRSAAAGLADEAR